MHWHLLRHAVASTSILPHNLIALLVIAGVILCGGLALFECGASAAPTSEFFACPLRQLNSPSPKPFSKFDPGPSVSVSRKNTECKPANSAEFLSKSKTASPAQLGNFNAVGDPVLGTGPAPQAGLQFEFSFLAHNKTLQLTTENQTVTGFQWLTK
jgi:hypothetical protein